MTKDNIKNRRSPMFNCYWDWTDFSVGFSVAKPHACTGWKRYVSLDIAFFSIWMYF